MHLNSFQKWARDYAGAFGLTVSPKGNWVVLVKGLVQVECMSAAGVQAACDTWGQ